MSDVRVLITGGGGQLAHDLGLAFGPAVAAAPGRAELDITDHDAVARALDAHQPTHVVNAAAYNLVDQAEDEPAAAFRVNYEGPRALALACEKAGATLVHVSTDYVYGQDAERHKPWRETDAPGPVSVYGVSKLAGEHAVLGNAPKALVVRTCGLYGVKGSRGKGGNFIETMLRLSAERPSVRVVADQHCTPSYCPDVAGAVKALVTAKAHGLFHVTNAGDTTWHGFAQTIFKLAGRETTAEPISSAAFGAKARRPAYSVLCGDRVADLTGFVMPDWRDALGRYLRAKKHLESA